MTTELRFWNGNDWVTFQNDAEIFGLFLELPTPKELYCSDTGWDCQCGGKYQFMEEPLYDFFALDKATWQEAIIETHRLWKASTK